MNKNKVAPMGSWNLPSAPFGQTQKFPIVSTNKYSTDVKTIKSANDAEKKGLELLREFGYEAIQSPDWLAKKDCRWLCLEIKSKALFVPPPYCGAGLDKSQVFLRNRLFQDLGIRTYLLTYEKGTDDIYGSWLDELEKGEFYDTKNAIRIYPIKNFSKGEEVIRRDLNGR